jgi:hypothetical protein
MNDSFPNRKWAVLADGTCDKCNRQLKGLAPSHHPYRKPFTDEQIRLASKSLAAYMEDRRRRGVDPEGDYELDARFEREWPKLKAAQRQKENAARAERKREEDRLRKQRQRERDAAKRVAEDLEAGRVPVPALRNNGRTDATAPEKSGHGGEPKRRRAREHNRFVRGL